MGEKYPDPIYFTSVIVFLGLIQMVGTRDPETGCCDILIGGGGVEYICLLQTDDAKHFSLDPKSEDLKSMWASL